MAIVVLDCDSLTNEDERNLLATLNGLPEVDAVLICTDEQARDVRRAVDW